MKGFTVGKDMHVVLSRKNLKTLLAKLDGHPPDSHCTIFREVEPGQWLTVVAEEDGTHYADGYGSRAPGEMHPDTEAVI